MLTKSTCNWMKTGLLVLALSIGACSSSSNNSPGDAAAGGTGGKDAAAGGSGGVDAASMEGGAPPTTIAGCGTLGSPAAIGLCIINLPTDSVGQAITTPPATDYNTCKM
jgi:hypothetical protein